MPHQSTDLYQGKYRSASNRLKGWDYSQNAFYFITLVTQHRECNLGKVINEEMILSDFGKIDDTEWLKSFDMRKELFLDEYVIMPNHLHAIIVVQNLEKEIGAADFAGTDDRRDEFPFASTEKKTNANPPSSFYRKPKSISSFVAGFKSAVNSKIDDLIDELQLPIPKYNRYNHFFQPNYHDHIIRNLLSYLRIKNYIRNNPKNWKADALKIS